EIGRSGRDGRPAFCHVILVREDYLRLRAMCFRRTVEEAAVRRFLIRLFQKEEEKEEPKAKGKGRKGLTLRVGDDEGVGEVSGNRRVKAVGVEECEKDLELGEGIVGMLVGWLEEESGGRLRGLGVFNAKFNVRFGKINVEELADRDAVVNAILKAGNPKSGGDWEVDSLKLCRELDIPPEDLWGRFNSLRRTKKLAFDAMDRSYFVEFDGNLNEEEADAFIGKYVDVLLAKCRNVEGNEVRKVDALYKIHSKATTPSLSDIKYLKSDCEPVELDDEDRDRLRHLRECVANYFAVDERVEGVRKEWEDVGDEELDGRRRDGRLELQTRILEFVNGEGGAMSGEFLVWSINEGP
ncbi:hypothetical protein HK097_010804, partial [Rhizophlyctis rosea]